MQSSAKELKELIASFPRNETRICPGADLTVRKVERFALETLVVSDFFNRHMQVYEKSLLGYFSDRKNHFDKRKVQFSSYTDLRDYMQKQEQTFVGAWWENFLSWVIYFDESLLNESKESQEILKNIKAWFQTMVLETTKVFLESIDPNLWIIGNRDALVIRIVQVLWRLASMELTQMTAVKSRLSWRLLDTPLDKITQEWESHEHKEKRVGCPALYAHFFRKIIELYLKLYLFPVFDMYSRRLSPKLK